MELSAEKTMYNFSRLPEPEGSGQPYTVSVMANILTPRDNEVQSAPTTATVYTLPIKPTNMRVDEDNNTLLWTK